MNKLLKLKAGEVLRNNHKLTQLYVSFRINYKFSIYNRFEWRRRIKEWRCRIQRENKSL